MYHFFKTVSLWLSIDYLSEQIREHIAGADLGKIGRSVFHHVDYGVAPEHGAGELSDQVSLDFLRVSVGPGVDILVDGAHRSLEGN